VNVVATTATHMLVVLHDARPFEQTVYVLVESRPSQRLSPVVNKVCCHAALVWTLANVSRLMQSPPSFRAECQQTASSREAPLNVLLVEQSSHVVEAVVTTLRKAGHGVRPLRISYTELTRKRLCAICKTRHDCLARNLLQLRFRMPTRWRCYGNAVCVTRGVTTSRNPIES